MTVWSKFFDFTKSESVIAKVQSSFKETNSKMLVKPLVNGVASGLSEDQQIPFV